MLSKNDLFALSLVEGVGAKSIKNIIDAKITHEDFDESILSVHIKGSKKKQAIQSIIDHFEDYQNKAEHSLIELQNEGIQLIAFSDKEYPYLYSKIPNPPIFLYAKGNIDLLNYEKNIAVIGTRQCSPFGKDVAKKTAKRFVEAGYNIVSGLALGIDTAAHEGALEAKGLTTAVLIDVQNVFPSENRDLANKILDKDGLLVAENPPGTFAHGGLFVSRDRLQSGLSEGVFPIETDIKGGTMHTVRFAEEQNRLLFCPDLYSIKDYPRNFDKSNGIMKLIKDSRATAYKKSDYKNIIRKLEKHKNLLQEEIPVEGYIKQLF
jgi:DNA processing protein